jgi:hypothetical protein
MMANAVRQNKDIKGFKIMDEEFKIVQFADDTCIFVQNPQSLKFVFHILEQFSKCAGLKANRDKTQAIGIGASSNFKHDIGIKWPDDSVKFLGVYINNNSKKMMEDNFNDKLNKIQEIVNIWFLRKMTLKGKVTIINSLLASQLIYLGTVFHTPQWVLKKYKDIIIKFLWDNKPSKVKYTNVIGTIEEGGLKLHDIEAKTKAIKVKWLHAICDTNAQSSAWKKYLSSHFQDELSQTLLYNRSSNDYPTFKDKFYEEIFMIWAELHNNNPKSGEEVCRQLIINNSFIRIDGNPITKKTWKHNEIKFIQNLLNREGKIDTRENIEKKYKVQIKPLTYNSITSAIPQKWKSLMKEDTNVNNYFVFADHRVILNGEDKKLIEISTKDVYNHLIKKIVKRATSENKWEEETGINYDEDQWERVYTLPYGLTRDVRILSFQYKTTHRILACKKNLKIWNITTDNICDVCCNDIDGIEHHLVACPVLLEFWDYFFRWWKSVSMMIFPVDTYDIIFGIPNPNEDLTISHMNYLILHALYYIYVTKIKKNTPKLYEYILEVKRNLNILQINMESKGQQKRFGIKWAPLADIL